MTSPYLAWLNQYVKDEYQVGWLFNLEDAHWHALMAENCGYGMRPLSRRINVAQRGTRAVQNIEHNEIDTETVRRPLYSTKLVEEA